MSDTVTVLAFVVPSITGLGGYLLSGFNDGRRDKRQRALHLEDRNHDFQRDALLEMQAAAQDFSEAAAQVLLHAIRSLRERDELVAVPVNLDTTYSQTAANYQRVMVRLVDDGVRKQLSEFYDFAAVEMELRIKQVEDVMRDLDLAGTGAAGELEEVLGELGSSYRRTNEAVGRVLRQELVRE